VGFGDQDATVLVDLNDGKTELGQLGYVLAARIGEVAAGDLPTAFD
jgi:hypothetical protein